LGNPSTPRSKLVEATRVTDSPIDPTPASHGADLEPDDLVGDYRIVRKIGHGGMGSVYEGIHPVIEKRVAIKVLRPELSKNEEAVARFTQEARAVNRIRHPSIVDVFGYGTTADGRCYLVMELLDGESLGRRIECDPPSVAEACDILIAITYALDAAHATGIVHRDLKPDNVFLVDGKHVKLLDFGIAKLTANEQPQMTAEYTQPGQAMGTPRYIAPEQARGDAIDARTDIYSLGVMAFELLCGRLPFVGDNAMELVAKHITLPPPTPSDISQTLPPIADTLLLQMLDKNPINRPPLSVVREQLDEIRAPWVTSITSPKSIAKPPLSAAQTIARPMKPAAKRGWILPLGLVLGLGAGAATFLVVRSMKEPEMSQVGDDRLSDPPPTETKERATAPEDKPPAKPDIIDAKDERKAEPKTEPKGEAKDAPRDEPPKPDALRPPKWKRALPQPAKTVVESTPTPPVVAPTPTPALEKPKQPEPEDRDKLMRPKFKKPTPPTTP
jgi:serine/threonine-protein kinase